MTSSADPLLKVVGMSMHAHYEVIGVGFCPSNIAMAIALEEESPSTRCLFLEKAASSQW
jgi:L-ornithine N5-oxygenase